MAPRNDKPRDTLLGGKIRLIQRIGRGGMGDVWFARNEATHAEVAVKTLLRSERTPTHDERFRREARLSATISHRNVVRVFDLLDEPDGTLGLVMELLRGSTLEAVMHNKGPLPVPQAMALGLPVLSAMHHVHQKGIIHRDVKPANIFLSVEPDGHVVPKVLDFGIAKLPAAGSALTLDGSVLGTPHYMAPEQIRGNEDTDGRGDMFSMAVLIYEMLTGRRVFQRDTPSASLAAVLEHVPEADPRIDARLWDALSRALAKRPSERYATCADFGRALREAVDTTDEALARALQELRPPQEVFRSDVTDPSAALPTDTALSILPPPRSPAVAIATGVGAAVLVGVVLVLMIGGRGRGAGAEPPASAMAVPPPGYAPAPPARTPRPGATAHTAPMVTADAAVAEDAPRLEASSVVPPSPVATPVLKRNPGPFPEKKPKPRTSGVATTPGF